MDERHLRTVLLDEAERHHPDRATMLSRVDRGRAAAAGRPMARVRAALAGNIRTRPTAAAFAVVLLLVLGITDARLFTPAPAPPATPVAAPTTASPATSRPAPLVHDGFLSATGALDASSTGDWAQSDLTLTAAETLTTLKVTVRIAHTAGVADTGHWTSIPAALVTAVVTEDDHELVYRFALADGATLAPGRYTLAVQYNHTGARALTGDSYLAAAHGVSNDKAEVTGEFLPR